MSQRPALTDHTARQLLEELQAAALLGRAGNEQLGQLTGRDMLRLDDNARVSSWIGSCVVSDARFDPEQWHPEIRTLTLLTIASMHANGWIRQRATHDLAARSGPIAAAALAVRSLDHVPQVRTEAVAALLKIETPPEIEQVIGVLGAAIGRHPPGRHPPSRHPPGRNHADATMQVFVQRMQQQPSWSRVVAGLRSSSDPVVSRWAFEYQLDHGDLDLTHLTQQALSHPDQYIRAKSAEQVTLLGTVEQRAQLVNSRFADVRYLGFAGFKGADLSTSALRTALMDTSARVRDLAQLRGRLRAIDIPAVYRTNLALNYRRGVCLNGLADTGRPADLGLASPWLSDPLPSVRKAAIAAVSALGAFAMQIALLSEMLRDPSPGVARAASKALSGAGAPPAVAARAWNSARPGTRKAAWLLWRGCGGWDRVEADLSAVADPDPQLVELGTMGLRNWLVASAPSMWTSPSEEQLSRLTRLLESKQLDDRTRFLVSFHAGLNPQP